MSSNEDFLIIDNISKRFDDVVALDKVSVKIKRSELFSLLGSSGCGKSTLLRIIAGFEKPDEGRIILDGQDITDLPPYLRPLNIMFQNYALFPHLNVYKNIEFGLKEEKLEKNLIEERINEALTLLELSALQKRKINEISGGQQQRVALARCLVKKPKLLLLDEPLAALDKKLRIQTQFELVNLQFKLGITFIIVTHDQEEAMSLSDRMAVMQQGNILQIGTPVEVYETPGNEYIANFIGTANIFEVNENQESKLYSSTLNAFINSAKAIPTNNFLLRPEKIEISKFKEGVEKTQTIKCIGSG
ncbi:MAG: ABC transporter ATP-binding protein, partial [Pelagibacteraceae bacterium]